MLLDQKVGFGPVILKVVDLAVKKTVFHQDIPSIVLTSDKVPHSPGEGEVITKVIQPAGNVLAADPNPILLTRLPGRFVEGVQAVIKGERINNNLEGKGFVFGDQRGELFDTARAEVKLDRLVLFNPQASFDDPGAVTVRTVGYRLGGRKRGFSHWFVWNPGSSRQTSTRLF